MNMMNSGDNGDSDGRNNNNKRIINNHNSVGESENESRPISDRPPFSGDPVDLYQDNSADRSKKYHRHTPQQIYELEKVFKECPHPDEKQRLRLSRRLKLDTRQVKFWFQNRRTHTKTLIERQEHSILEEENQKLRQENLMAKEAMRNPACRNCGGPAMLGEEKPKQQQLVIENVRLKAELQRICTLAGKFLGRPLSNMTSSFNSGCVLNNGFVNQMADLGNNQLVVASSNDNGNVGVDGSGQKSKLFELASAAMDELMKMGLIEEPLWMKDGENGREMLNFDEYRTMFQRHIGAKPEGCVKEASRASGVVVANSTTLVEMLMDDKGWADMFPSLIATTTTTDVIYGSVGGTRDGVLQLMEASFQVLSPFVPTREVKFLRFCKHHSDGLWGIVDVSINGIHEFATATNGNVSCCRFPSGCIVQDMPNGYSKVTWVEHAEYDESTVHNLYRSLLKSGLGLGAQRWLANLQRQCECLAFLFPSPSTPHNQSGQSGMTTIGKRSLLKLAQRMTKNFCASISALSSSSVHKWSKVISDDIINENIRVIFRQSMNDPGEPNGVVLNAATSVSLPLCPTRIFDFLKDVSRRSMWDILANGRPVQEMTPIIKGHNPGNAVSLLRSDMGNVNGNESSMLILQETCTDVSGSLMVYAPVDIPAMHLVMNGGDSSGVVVLPSGFAVAPDGDNSKPGSLLTVALQILVNSDTNAKLSVQSVQTINNLVANAIQSIKVGLNLED